MSTKYIKSFFVETLQFIFVLVMHLETYCLTIRHGYGIHCIIEFGIIRNEPINDAQRNVMLTFDDGHYFVQIVFIVKFQQIFKQHLILGVTFCRN